MKHLDLCSGIGGFALAARWMGWHTIGFAEIDPFASKVLEKHWPGVPNHGDIANVPAGIEADIITAGFPCQPYSCAGKRLGAEDDRAIWPQMLRVVSSVRPRWVVAENVAGFIGMALDDVLSDLEKEGYQTGAIILPACAVDAQHRRDRVWIVAHADSVGSWAGERSEIERKKATYRGSFVADSDRSGREEQRRSSAVSSEQSAVECDRGRLAQSILGRVADGLPARMDRPFDREPDVPRVAVGIKQRRERLKSLGNAIVPQVAAEIIRAMMLADRLANTVFVFIGAIA